MYDIYLIMSFFFGSILLISFILQILGIDIDIIDIDNSPITIRGISAFFIGMGLGGLYSTEKGYETTQIIFNSFLLGIIFLSIIILLMYITKKLDKKEILNRNDLINTIGEVTIPTNKENKIGKMALSIEGSYREVDMISLEDFDLKINDMVIVEKVEKFKYYVKKYIK